MTKCLHERHDCCAVQASPELQDRLKAQADAMRSSMSDLTAFSEMLSFRFPVQFGLNDGVIIPANHFPLGTPTSVVRSAAADRAPLRGTVRVIVVLVQFPGKNMTQTAQHFKDLFFSAGKISTGSVKEYYKEVTHGLVDITGDVVGPFTLAHPITYYAHGQSGMGTTAPNAQNMAREAAELANPSVNFAPYDNDGNGYVDAFIVVHAGPGAEVSGSHDDIWSHKWVISGGEYNADGTKIYGYLTVPEDCKLGVCAHELGHLLFGFPDLYDTDYSSQGIGNWCLMAGGSWNGGGNTPAHPSAWCKANQGWASVTVQNTTANVNIPDVKASNNVIRLWKDAGAGSEYFLLENRQKTGFDSQLPGSGLLIWHVDESVSGNSNENHPKVALMQADGKRDLEKNANRGDAGDPFPGTANNRSFTHSTTPNSDSYGNVNTCVSVTNIGDSAATMTARLAVRCAKIKEIAKEVVKETVKELKVETKEAKVEVKEVRDKPNIEGKPIIDKSGGLDKITDRPGGSGLGGGGGLGGGVQGLTGGVAGGGQPFIPQQMRPDLSQGAMQGEEGQSQFSDAMGQGDSVAKRLFDHKLREF